MPRGRVQIRMAPSRPRRSCSPRSCNWSSSAAAPAGVVLAAQTSASPTTRGVCEAAGQRLQPARGIDGIADHREGQTLLAADITDDRGPVIEPDADRERRLVLAAPLAVPVGDRGDHQVRACERVGGIVRSRIRQRRTPRKSHRRYIFRRFRCKRRSAPSSAMELAQHRHHRFGRHPFRHPGEADDVDEQHARRSGAAPRPRARRARTGSRRCSARNSARGWRGHARPRRAAARCSRTRPISSRVFRMVISRSLRSTGLVTKSKAPRFIAVRMLAMSP